VTPTIPGPARPDKIIGLVTRTTESKKKQVRAAQKQSPKVRPRLNQNLTITTQDIDALLYDPYGLTVGEIRIVEGQT
jgi:hypothetical protein